MNADIYKMIFAYGAKIVGWENESVCLEFSSGNRGWYINGKLHRTNGPAAEYTNGNKYWYLNSKLHREDGPAIEHANGYEEWYLNGKKINHKVKRVI